MDPLQLEESNDASDAAAALMCQAAETVAASLQSPSPLSVSFSGASSFSASESYSASSSYSASAYYSIQDRSNARKRSYQ